MAGIRFSIKKLNNVTDFLEFFDDIRKFGNAWESNPPSPALRNRPPILKTGASTGTHALPPRIITGNGWWV